MLKLLTKFIFLAINIQVLASEETCLLVNAFNDYVTINITSDKPGDINNINNKDECTCLFKNLPYEVIYKIINMLRIDDIAIKYLLNFINLKDYHAKEVIIRCLKYYDSILPVTFFNDMKNTQNIEVLNKAYEEFKEIKNKISNILCGMKKLIYLDNLDELKLDLNDYLGPADDYNTEIIGALDENELIILKYKVSLIIQNLNTLFDHSEYNEKTARTCCLFSLGLFITFPIWVSVISLLFDRCDNHILCYLALASFSLITFFSVARGCLYLHNKQKLVDIRNLLCQYSCALTNYQNLIKRSLKRLNLNC